MEPADDAKNRSRNFGGNVNQQCCSMIEQVFVRRQETDPKNTSKTSSVLRAANLYSPIQAMPEANFEEIASATLPTDTTTTCVAA